MDQPPNPILPYAQPQQLQTNSVAEPVRREGDQIFLPDHQATHLKCCAKCGRPTDLSYLKLGKSWIAFCGRCRERRAALSVGAAGTLVLAIALIAAYVAWGFGILLYIAAGFGLSTIVFLKLTPSVQVVVVRELDGVWVDSLHAEFLKHYEPDDRDGDAGEGDVRKRNQAD